MATNNYYGGFTHGGTQYGTAYTPPPGTQGFAAAQTYGGQNAGTGAGQTPQAYGAPDPYVIGGYTRPAAGQQAQAQSLQQQQGYYNQQSTGYPNIAHKIAGAAPLQARPGATSTVYPTYSANTTGTTSSASYAGFSAPQTQQNTSGGAGGKASFTNYDAAVYNAVTAYAQGGTRGGGGGGGGFKKGPKGIKGARPMPKPQTLHYCDVCKISCAGPQTYKEHLDGQKHKKKEAAQKTGAPAVPKGGPAGLRCELCDVTCTGSDAYAAHIRGAKHQKVLKLHTKLGKPIPSDNPTVVAPSSSTTSNSCPPSSMSMGTTHKPNPNAAAVNNLFSNGIKSTANATLFPSPSQPANANANGANNFAKPATPKINFIGNAAAAKPADASSPGTNDTAANANSQQQSQSQMSTTYAVPAGPGGDAMSPTGANSIEYIEKDVQPVGQDYIEEIRSDDGKIVSFNCKLCDCRFNDPNAKEMHMKGRRHRLQYKKKVNPDLVVDVKPSSRQKKMDERRSTRSLAMRKMPMPNDPYGRGAPVPLIPPGAARGFGPGFGSPANSFFIPPLIRRPETVEDRHVMTKHGEIYPEEHELQAIQKIVSNTEKALKFVSDRFAEEDCKIGSIKAEDGGEIPPPTEADLQNARKLKGVMRVGHLAKGLLLRGDRTVELVVLCSEKPTVSTLDRVLTSLPAQLQIVAPEEKYDIRKEIPSSGLVISSTDDPRIDVTVTLTSPALRGAEAPGEAQATQVTDPIDSLEKEKCLDALAALRHAKWFQARATTLQSCVIVIRILRDLSQRVPAFQALSCWAIELLTEKAINSAGMPISPGEALRIVLEVMATGLLLPSGPGLLDPCEKESRDAIAELTNQQREDITAYAQQALRQVAFRQIHTVLGMEALPRYNKKSPFNNRKRRRDPSGNTDGDESAAKDGKKDKKEESVETEKLEIKSEVI